MKKILGMLMVLSLTGFAFAVPVALELSLVLDVSGSVNPNEWTLQKNGYVAAFSDAGIQADIASLAGQGGIAVNVIQFSTTAVQSIGWTQLTSAADATSFSTALSGMSRVSSGCTDIEDGVKLATGSITSNSFEGTRKVIDVSGDGIQNNDDNTTYCNQNPFTDGVAVLEAARNDATSKGIVINGIAIGTDKFWNGSNYITTADYYTSHMATGFVLSAATFNDFAAAVKTKIAAEINNEDPTIPEPTTIFLMGLGLAGLLFFRRKKA